MFRQDVPGLSAVVKEVHNLNDATPYRQIGCPLSSRNNGAPPSCQHIPGPLRQKSSYFLLNLLPITFEPIETDLPAI